MQQDFLVNNKRKKKTKRVIKKRRIILLIMLTLFFVAAVYIVNYIPGRIAEILINLEELTGGEIMSTVPVMGLILKEEEVILAPSAGQLDLKIKEGERVSVGGIIADISGGYDAQFT
ncbi:MAG: HlyD family efflux transporter periplasmic adaptor subunit, partial [Bacillota bacterium]|nr:HlyD family efflux transporter periplasmic adaptor subunit [Bacillota bacterium]